MGVSLTPKQLIGDGILGIQGDSQTGKTTLGFALGPLLVAEVFETSNGFRGFTVWAQHMGVHYLDRQTAEDLATRFVFGVVDGRVIVSGLDVTDDLRAPETDRQVSHFASYKRVRMEYTKAMLSWVDVRPAIVIGRHIREVFPEAQLILQTERHDNVILARVSKRLGGDHRKVTQARTIKDRENASVALKGITDDYVVLDTTGLTKIQQRDGALHEALKAGFTLAPGRMRTAAWI